MITVCIESPLSGDFATNIAYARACLRYCLEQGVSPYASHLLLPQVYDDINEAQREAGIQAGLVMGNYLTQRWYFMDLNEGESTNGMKRAAVQAPSMQPYKKVHLGTDWRTRYPATPTPGF